MKNKCVICKNVLPDPSAPCPNCGFVHASFKDANFCKVGEDKKIFMSKADYYFTEDKLIVQNANGKLVADIAFGLIGSLIASSAKKKTVLEPAWSEIGKIEFPLKEKYGSKLVGLTGESGLIIELTNGDRYFASGNFKSTTQKIVEAFKARGVVVE